MGETPMTAAPIKIITGINDVTFVDTPVTYHGWNNEARVEHQPVATLYDAEEGSALVTVVRANGDGDPFVEAGRIRSAAVLHGALYILFTPRGERKGEYL